MMQKCPFTTILSFGCASTPHLIVSTQIGPRGERRENERSEELRHRITHRNTRGACHVGWCTMLIHGGGPLKVGTKSAGFLQSNREGQRSQNFCGCHRCTDPLTASGKRSGQRRTDRYWGRKDDCNDDDATCGGRVQRWRQVKRGRERFGFGRCPSRLIIVPVSVTQSNPISFSFEIGVEGCGNRVAYLRESMRWENQGKK